MWWREGDVLLTPALELGILAGETRAALLDLAAELGYRVEEGEYPVGRLLRGGRGLHLVVGPRGACRSSRSTTASTTSRDGGGAPPGGAPAGSRGPDGAASPRPPRMRLPSREPWPGSAGATLASWRSFGSAAWPSRTACSCTGRRPGAPPFGCRTARSRSASGPKPRIGARVTMPFLRGPAAARGGGRRPAARQACACPRRGCRSSGRRSAVAPRRGERRREPRAALVAPDADTRGDRAARLDRARPRRAAGRRAHLVPRCGARLDRDVRDRRARREGARSLRLAPRRPADADDGARRRRRRARARAPPAGGAPRRHRRRPRRGRRDLRLDEPEPRSAGWRARSHARAPSSSATCRRASPPTSSSRSPRRRSAPAWRPRGAR